MQISLFISDSYSINLCLGYQLCLICLLIPLYFSIHLHRYPGIFLPNVWTLPSESCLPFCLVQVYSYLCGQGGDVTAKIKKNKNKLQSNYDSPNTILILISPIKSLKLKFGRRTGSKGQIYKAVTNMEISHHSQWSTKNDKYYSDRIFPNKYIQSYLNPKIHKLPYNRMTYKYIYIKFLYKLLTRK